MTNIDPFPSDPANQPRPPVDDLDAVWSQAVQVLTQAVRLTYHGTPAQPIDFADFLASVLVAVAANVGSIERLIAGRSGSWEADLVYRLVHSTVGDDPNDLLPYRTEPVRVPLNVAALVEDEGREADPAVVPYWEAVDAAIDAADPDPPADRTHDEWTAIYATLERIEDEIDQRYTAAYVDYANRFRRTVEQHAATIEGLVRSGVNVEVVTVTDPEGEWHETIVNPSEWDEPDPLVWDLWNRARQQLGLPRP